MIAHLLYIDPGSGGMLVQIIIGAVLAVGVFFRSVRDRFRALFHRKKDTPSKPL